MIIYLLLLMQFYYKEGCAHFKDDDYDVHYVSHTSDHSRNSPSSINNGSIEEVSQKLIEMEYKLEIIKLFKKHTKMEEAADDFIDMKHDVTPPDIGNATKVPRGGHFSNFVKKHMDAALDLVHYLLRAENTGDLVTMGNRVRSLVNEKLFKFALSSVISAKNFGLEFPAIFEADPGDFIPYKYVRAIKKKHKQIHDIIKLMKNKTRSGRQLMKNKTRSGRQLMKNKTRSGRQLGNQPTITWRELQRGVYAVTSVADLSARNPDLESRMSYFRDDYGVNSHHYNWHLVHLNDRSREAWQVIVPRRLDLFIYMHQQVLARYNFERLSCNVPLTKSWGDSFRIPILEGHIPDLGHDSDEYAVRRPNSAPMNWQLINLVEGLRRQIDNGLQRRIVNDELFLQTVERYHNDGHLLISLTHHETNRGGQRVGVMFEAQTSMRDPVFYRWHQHLEDIYQLYDDMKATELTYDDFEEEDLVIAFVDVSSTMDGHQMGEVVTGCNTFNLEATNGFDFDGNEEVFVRMTHLDHIPFTYDIGVENLGNRIPGMVRIFLAPLLNDRGRRMDFEEQRELWIEMDKFIHVFSHGRNRITRESSESTVAVNCRNTFRDVTERITHPHGQLTDGGHCGCGWPQHLLLPRGWDGDGMPVQLFIMITREEHIDHSRQASRSTYCGVPGVEQPDRKPMGYPFHSRARGIRSIRDFQDRLPNAFVKDIQIIFSGRQVDPNKPDSPDCPHM